MRVLILGAAGMLGKDLLPILSTKHEVLGKDIHDFDITDRGQVQKELGAYRPDMVINAAAYTNVDGCESQRDLAFAANAEGARQVALGCAAVGSKMVHLSTDYVFDGTAEVPYREEDPPHPLNVYGSSKLLGERYIQETFENYLIIRTAWLYGRHGKNFVDTILGLAKQQKDLRVVNDQQGSPTFTRDLSWAIARLLEKEVQGILHVTNSGSCTWFEFAQQILKNKNLSQVRIIPITTPELGRAAKRPAYSVFDCSRLKQIGLTMRPWEEGLKEYLS